MGAWFLTIVLGIPITDPTYWIDSECTDQILGHVFRSATTAQIPLLDERISCLREVGRILSDVSPSTCLPREKLSLMDIVQLGL